METNSEQKNYSASLWSPDEVRKLIAQLTGVITIIFGYILISLDAKADGTISLKISEISSSIESSSAGLFFAFFGFWLVLYPTIKKRNVKSSNNLLVIIGFAVILIAVTLIVIFVDMGRVIIPMIPLLLIFMIRTLTDITTKD